MRNLYFSVEPAIRARLDGKETYMPPIGIGEPIQSPTVGRVVRSNHPDYQEGEVLFGFNNWDDYVIVTDDTLLLERLSPEEGMPLSYYVGALGGSGTHGLCRAARRSGGSRPARPWSSARPPVAWAASPGRSRACGVAASWDSSARPTRPPSSRTAWASTR